ncbi:MAG: hypothetical protein ACLUKN_06585 [Bacilli bacterium]
MKSATLKNFFDKLRKPIAFIIVLMGIKAASYVLMDDIGSILLWEEFLGAFEFIDILDYCDNRNFIFDILTAKFSSALRLR